MYIDELKAQAGDLASKTGGNIHWAAEATARKADFQKFAAESGNKRYLATARKAVAGTDRAGHPLSEREREIVITDMIVIVAAEIVF